LGESKIDLSRDNVDHRKFYCPNTVDLAYKPSLESDSVGGREIFMVAQGEPPPTKPKRRSLKQPK
jgi:hypothetical protein